MATPHILITGVSIMREFLENLADEVAGDGMCVDCILDLENPSDYPDWNKTTILVSLGVKCSAEDMGAAPLLRAIITPSLGYEGIDVAAARQRNIEFANGRVPENFESVAEAAVLFMLMSLYRVREAEERAARGARRTGPPVAQMLKGKTIGLIGYGNITKALIKRLAGWETEILVHNRSPMTCPGAKQVPLDALLQASDIVLPLVPLTEETRGLLSRERMLSMKRGAILINLSRGAVIDEAALGETAVASHLGAVGLDVFVTEPLPLTSPLWTLPDRILTNHEIAHTQENLDALFAAAVRNIQAAIAGQLAER